MGIIIFLIGCIPGYLLGDGLIRMFWSSVPKDLPVSRNFDQFVGAMEVVAAAVLIFPVILIATLLSATVH